MDKEKISELLTKYNHPNSMEGLTLWENEFLRNKGELIELMKKHPNYNGNYQIVFKEDFDREIDASNIRWVVRGFIDNLKAKSKLIKKTNPQGKTFDDCMKENLGNMPKIINANDLVNLQPLNNISDFNNHGDYIPSINNYERFKRIIDKFAYHWEPTVTQELLDNLGNDIQGINIVNGMKTSKALWRVIMQFGFDEKEAKPIFTPYGDMINPLKRKVTVVISANPYDYLTMSFGNTWSSCHTINKGDSRTGYSGAYCSGTVSYMLDSTSLVVYTIIEDEMEHPEYCKKMYRNMFHWNGAGILIQGRVYPQSNDGGSNLYTKFRHIMQREVCQMLGHNYIEGSNGNDTWIKSNNSRSMYFVSSKGTHYRDYTSFGDCNWTKIRGYADPVNNDEFVIGHEIICPKCGGTHMISNRIACNSCR